MINFVKAFLIFTILYHILVTVVCYGIFGGQYQETFSLIRDGVRILRFLFLIVWHRKSLHGFLRIWKYPLISFGILLLFGIGISKQLGKNRSDIFIGIKYGIRYLWILFSAAFAGYLLAKTKQENRLNVFLRFTLYLLVALVAFGFLRQYGKILFPDFFTWIGYGPLNDFAFGVKPPLFYLTGYEGTLRWQGIFAGPNNYGYFLVVLLPIIILFFKTKISSLKSIFKDRCALINSLIIALWFVAIVATLSRSALIGTMVVIIFLFRSRIKKHRKIFTGLLVVCLLGLVGLSFLKSTSTLAHITQKFSSLNYVIKQPLGYGLGSSGPAIHHNGSMLPENYFIQLMIDIGTVGFLLWIFCISQLGAITRAIKILPSPQTPLLQRGDNFSQIYMIWKGLTIGRIALLVMGMFLHVFEDSMVNYLFFILRGITTGFLSYGLKGVKIGLWDFWKRK